MTSWVFSDLYTPAVSQPLDGACDRAWFGWYCSEAMQKLRGDGARTEDRGERKAFVEEIQKLTYDEVPYVPLGQWSQRRAYRNHVKGVLPFAAPLLWNVWLDKPSCPWDTPGAHGI